MENESKVKAVIKKLVDDIPAYKLSYAIRDAGLATGLKLTIHRYGAEYNKEVHELLVEIVEDILTDGSGIEYDWSEEQYENFVKFKELPESTAR